MKCLLGRGLGQPGEPAELVLGRGAADRPTRPALRPPKPVLCYGGSGRIYGQLRPSPAPRVGHYKLHDSWNAVVTWRNIYLVLSFG